MPQWISPQTLLRHGTNLDQDRCEQLPICSMDASRMVCFVLPSIGKLKVKWYIERHRTTSDNTIFVLLIFVVHQRPFDDRTDCTNATTLQVMSVCMGGFVQFLRVFTILLSLLHVLSFWWLTVCQCLWSLRSSWETIDYGGLTMPGVEAVLSSESFGWLLRPSFRF